MLGFLALLLSASLFAVDQKRFVSDQYGYSLRVPKRWHVSVSANGIPVFFNYDPKILLPQGLFPEHGAHIFLIPFTGVRPMVRGKGMSEWIKFNNSIGCSNIVINRLLVPKPSEKKPSNVVEVHADFQRDPQDEVLERVVDYYFTLHGEDFRLMLEYWKGDAKSAHFESVLDEIFGSIEPR